MSGIVLILPLLAPAFALAAPPASRPTTRPAVLTPGDYRLELQVDGLARSYLVHVPPQYDPKKPMPVVLAFHSAFTNGAMMVGFCGLNRKADTAGFVAVYPNGTGSGDILLFWNAGGRPSSVDDVKFVGKMLDDLAAVMNVDPKRVYATGMSNGAFMCYRLAAELSDRIAAIAPVSGALAIENPKPTRPVPIIHFHGTADSFVPFAGPNQRTPRNMKFMSVEDTARTWAKLNGCPEQPATTTMPDTARDGTMVRKTVYGPGKDGAEVVLFVIKDGGHTWPGQQPPVGFIGKSTMSISANDLMWEFFQRHPIK